MLHRCAQGVARGDGVVRREIELRLREVLPGEVALLHDLRIQLHRDEAGPVDHRRTGEDPVEVGGVGLRLLGPLTATGAEAVPVGMRRRRAVVRGGERLGLDGHLVDPARGEVGPQGGVHAAVGQHGEVAVGRLVAGVGDRGDGPFDARDLVGQRRRRDDAAERGGRFDGRAPLPAAATDDVDALVPVGRAREPHLDADAGRGRRIGSRARVARTDVELHDAQIVGGDRHGAGIGAAEREGVPLGEGVDREDGGVRVRLEAGDDRVVAGERRGARVTAVDGASVGDRCVARILTGSDGAVGESAVEQAAVAGAGVTDHRERVVTTAAGNLRGEEKHRGCTDGARNKP